jgi:hypothetical protein
MAEKTERIILEIEGNKLVSVNGRKLEAVDCPKISGDAPLTHIATVYYSTSSSCCFIWNGRCYPCLE